LIDSKQKLYERWSALVAERSTWTDHWKDISDYLLPRQGRFFVSDRNKGTKRHNNIYDNTGTKALRTLGAGMMAGATSPARQWFKLSTSDSDLNKFEPVKMWLSDVTKIMQSVFRKSNAYRSFHTMYEEKGAFGTSAALILPDFNNVIHFHTMTAGEYCITTDHKGKVNTLYRRLDKRVSTLVSEFGYKNCSKTVQNLFDKGSLDNWITVIHAVEPRKDRDYRSKLASNMAWKSCYFEEHSRDDKLLKVSGFKESPIIGPRWAVYGGDIYGTSPAMDALGDVKQLQHEQLRKAQAIDYQTKPPLQVPASMKNSDVDQLPGGITYYDGSMGSQSIKSAFDVKLDLSYLLNDIQDVRGRVNSAFYADLFLLLANATDTRMTATEVAERHEEKLLMLGPVVERLHNEMLDPIISATFATMVKAGLVPPPPPDLQGKELSVEFVSMLAQAQKAVMTNSVDRYVASMGSIAALKPGVLDNLDEDKWADVYADMLGVDPTLIIPDDKVALVRQQRAQAEQQQAQAEQMKGESETVKNLAGAQTAEPSALTNVIDMFSGYNTP